jgi:hypothetical protein
MSLLNKYKCYRVFKFYPLTGEDEIETFFLLGILFSNSKIGYEKIFNTFYPYANTYAGKYFEQLMNSEILNIYYPYLGSRTTSDVLRFVAAYSGFLEGKKIKSIKQCAFNKNKLDEIHLSTKTLLLEFLNNPNKYKKSFDNFLEDTDLVIKKLNKYIDKEK